MLWGTWNGEGEIWKGVTVGPAVDQKGKTESKRINKKELWSYKSVECIVSITKVYFSIQFQWNDPWIYTNLFRIIGALSHFSSRIQILTVISPFPASSHLPKQHGPPEQLRYLPDPYQLSPNCLPSRLCPFYPGYRWPSASYWKGTSNGKR